MQEEIVGLNDVVRCWITEKDYMDFWITSAGPALLNGIGKGKVQNEKVIGRTIEEISKDAVPDYVEKVEILREKGKVAEYILEEVEE